MATKNTPTFILHGWTTDISKWQPLTSLLKKKGVPAKILKIPGLTSKLDKSWTLNNYVSWLSKEIGQHSSVNLIAHSFGGRVALRFDIKNPNTVKKLVLIDSAGIRPVGIAATLKRVSFKAIAKLGKHLTKNQRARQMLYHLAQEKDYYQANHILAKTMANVIEDDQRPELSFVKAHTLIIWGSGDKVTPLRDGRLINKTITGSTLKIIDGAKHSPQYTHPEQVSELISHFLKSSR